MKIITFIELYWKWVVAAIIPLAAFFLIYPNYIVESTFFWVCIITLPISIQSQSNGKDRLTFILTIALGTLSLLLPTVMGVYLMICLVLIFLLQSIVGRINYTLIVHMLLASPLFLYVKSLISFPVRLELSKIASNLLQLIGMDVRIEGNMVFSGDSSFLVDEACAGMFMLGYGLLFGTIILSIATRTRALPIYQLTLYYLILLVLILLGNVVRITLLIIFEIMPDQWMHEALGVIIYVFQILIPFYFITNLGSKHLLGKNHSSIKNGLPIFPLKRYAIMLCLLCCVIIAQVSKVNSTPPNQVSFTRVGFKSVGLKNNITKLQNEQALIYIKPPVAPYRADHNPMICWQGSGYKFKKIEKWSVNKTSINHAELIKGDDKIYTAWWFVSENYQTGDQLEWRKQGLMKGESYYLINVTCNSKQELHKQVQNLLTQNILSNRKS
ncbi:MAG: exosortase N [Fulvivirga sp.]